MTSCWVLTDGKAGDETQCLGVAEALGLAPEIRRVAPRRAFAWLMPRGPIDPRDASDRRGSPIAPPFPDLLIASGRRAVPYVRAVKRASGGRTFTVILKDPRTGASAADLIWVPEHDRLRGPNVIATPTAPHRISEERLAAARRALDPRVAALPPPRVAVLVGGDSRHHRFTQDDRERFVRDLRDLAGCGIALGITTSRRTPPALLAALQAMVAGTGHFLWAGEGDNPYLSLLAGADGIVVTADSTNMVGEAVATGRPVMVFEPSCGHPKIRAYLDTLAAMGAVRPFSGRLEAYAYLPLNSTREIARSIRAALDRHR